MVSKRAYHSWKPVRRGGARSTPLVFTMAWPALAPKVGVFSTRHATAARARGEQRGQSGPVEAWAPRRTPDNSFKTIGIDPRRGPTHWISVEVCASKRTSAVVDHPGGLPASLRFRPNVLGGGQKGQEGPWRPGLPESGCRFQPCRVTGVSGPAVLSRHDCRLPVHDIRVPAFSGQSCGGVRTRG